jgi:inner membrane protein
VLARDAAQVQGFALAAARGHAPAVVDAKPSFANLLLWKTVYRAGDRFYVDAVRLGQTPTIYPGQSIAALDIARDFPWLDPASLQARDIERFRWFSMGFIAADPAHPGRVMDLRYSLLPNEIRPLWSIQLDPDTQHDEHVRYLVHRERGPDTLARFRAMLAGASLSAAVALGP